MIKKMRNSSERRARPFAHLVLFVEQIQTSYWIRANVSPIPLRSASSAVAEPAIIALQFLVDDQARVKQRIALHYVTLR